MACSALLCIGFLALLPLTVPHQCVQDCLFYLTFDEAFDALPVTCNQTYQSAECYSEISFDYVSRITEIKLGERSAQGENITSDDYYISQKTEMWHETYNLQWTVVTHRCYRGDLCDFEYARMKVRDMRRLTSNFDRFQEGLSAALLINGTGGGVIQCLSTEGQSVTCTDDIKSCSLHVDNIYTNKTHGGCSSFSDDQSRKQLEVVEETAYFLNGQIDARQSSVEYVCTHPLCNGQKTYRDVAQLLIEYNLLRDSTPIEPPSSASNIEQPLSEIFFLVPLLSYCMFHQ